MQLIALWELINRVKHERVFQIDRRQVPLHDQIDDVIEGVRGARPLQRLFNLTPPEQQALQDLDCPLCGGDVVFTFRHI